MGNNKRKHRDVPMGLGLVHANASSVTALPAGMAANVPHLRPKRPNLNGGPQLTLVHSMRQAATPKPKPQAVSYKPLAPTLTQALGYHNLKIVDIANNFATRMSRENVGKVYAAAAALNVQFRPVSRAGMSGLFAQNAVSMKPRVASIAPAANDMHFRPRAQTFAPRVGGSSVLRAIFGRSPMEGTGYRSYTPATPRPAYGFSAPKFRMAA